MSVENEDQGGLGAAEPSLRDDLAAALTEVKERDAADDAGDGGDPGLADDGKPARSDGRNERGQFAGKGGEATPPDATLSPEANATAAADPAGADAEVTAPKSWRQTEAAAWAAMPPEARQAVLRREQEISTLVGRQDGERQFGREVADIFRPYAEDITRAGATPQLALTTLLNNHKALRSQNPAERIGKARELLMDYGIDPRDLAQPDPNMPQDPHVQNLMRTVQGLQQQLATRSQDQTQYAPLPASPEDATDAFDIEAFAADPAHPHFVQVANHMADLIESGAASDPEIAYQMAVSARPTLRSTPPANPATEAQRSREVAAARQAGVSVTGSPGTTSPPKPLTIRDELRQELRRHGIS